MRKELMNYFQSLASSDKTIDISQMSYDCQFIPIEGKLYYKKHLDEQYSVAGMISSKMYKDIGIMTPEYYLGKDERTPLKPSLYTLCQKIHQTPNYRVVSGHEALGMMLLQFKHVNDYRKKWDIINRPDVRDEFLKYMTEECLDELIGIFLADELRTESDRNSSNYYLAINKKTGLGEHVISIDHDNVMIVTPEMATNREEFNTFLYLPTQTYTATQRHDFRSHHGRLRDIKQLLQDGKISDKNIDLLKRATSYDLPALAKKTIDNHPEIEEYRKFIVTPTSYLWEENRRDLGRELGL